MKYQWCVPSNLHKQDIRPNCFLLKNEINKLQTNENNKWVFRKWSKSILSAHCRKEICTWMKNKWEWNKRVIPKFWIVDKQETKTDINETFCYLKMSLFRMMKLLTVDVFNTAQKPKSYNIKIAQRPQSCEVATWRYS